MFRGAKNHSGLIWWAFVTLVFTVTQIMLSINHEVPPWLDIL